MGASFRSAQEFRTVIDEMFGLMDGPEFGPALRDAGVAQRFAFDDLGLVVNVRPARPEEDRNIVWAWSDEVDWSPDVELTMTSEVANRYFQGKESVALALARRRIKVRGDLQAALAVAPIVKPAFARYVELIERSYPHLRL